MLADVGTVITYSNSAHVNDLGFAWTGPPCCMDRLAHLFAWTSPPPCSYSFSARWFYLAGTHYTIPTSALVSILLWNANYSWASQLLRLPNNSDNKGTFSESWQGV